jgi:hypothetical protein
LKPIPLEKVVHVSNLIIRLLLIYRNKIQSITNSWITHEIHSVKCENKRYLIFMGFNFWSLLAIICFIIRQRITMYKRNAGKVLNMNELTINKRCGKLIVKCHVIPHYAYTHRYHTLMNRDY